MNCALIIGGSGQIGRAAGLALLKAKWRVYMTSRDARPIDPELTTRGAIWVNADAQIRADMIRNIGRTLDAVVDTTAYDAADSIDLLAVEKKVGAYVVISSASVYADAKGRSLDEARKGGFPEFGGAIPEATSTVAPGPSTYSTRKVAMELAMQESKLPIVLLRPCAIYGIGGRHLREWWFLRRLIDGRTDIPLAYKAMSRFHTSSAEGIGNLIAKCLENPKSCILNVADKDAVTVAEIGQVIAKAVGKSIQLRPFDGPPIEPELIGSSPWSVPRSFTLDIRSALDLGWDPGPGYATAVGPVCRWAVARYEQSLDGDVFPLSKHYGLDVFNYAAEDKKRSKQSI